ncbi:MAG: hypothetical protein ACI9G1_002517 [Pirellulaceae bacterium]|jgi:hypothetical protein
MRIKVRTVLCPILTILLFQVSLPTMVQAVEAPVKLIFDTDIGPDCDDAGAAAVLHALADQGEVEILAMMVSTGGETAKWGPPCLDAINTFYGRPDIPIGVIRKKGAEDTSKYNEQLAKEFPNDLQHGDRADEATQLYRKVLSSQPDGSVVIVSVGYLSNLRHLLESKGDEHSELNGIELVKQKVKTYVCMGGTFPKGREWNIHRDTIASKQVAENWPTSIYFSGFEIGNEIHTGNNLKDKTPTKNPVRRAYQLYTGGKDRQSWDQTAVLFAIRGLNGKLKDFWELSAAGRLVLAEDGANTWDSASGKHRYLIKKKPPSQIAAEIEALMLLPPKSKK